MLLPWGGVWDVAVINVTAYPEFNFFFTLMVVFGLIAWMIGLVINVIVRS